jgi:ATP-binding cassette subfamily B protein
VTTPTAGAAAPESDPGALNGRAVRLLVRSVWQASKLSAIALVTSVVVNGLVPVATVLTAGTVIGGLPKAVETGEGTQVERATLLLGALYLLQQLAKAIQSYVAEHAGAEMERALRERVMAACAAPATVAHLDDPEVLDLIAQASTVRTARYGPRSALSFGVTGMAGFVTGFSMAALLSTLHWWMGPLLVATWLVVRRQVLSEAWILYKVIGFQTAADRRGGYFRDLALTGSAAKEIRLFGLADWITGRFQDHWDGSMEPIHAERKGALAPMRWLGLLVVVVHAFLLTVIVRAATAGDIDLRHLAILIQALALVAILGDGTRDDVVIRWGASTIPAVARLEEALNQRETLGTQVLPPLTEALTTDRLAYRYPGRAQDVFTDLDLQLPAGRSMAIVGHNGAGKTTLVKLLTGLLHPTSGRVLVDGADLREADAEAWQQQVSVVFQDFVHYELSLRDNICLATPGSDADLDEVLDQAGLRAVLQRLPKGLDTILSTSYEGGVSLSGGEWQRVALARALWSVRAGARLLVLDEPTANLDVRAEADFYDRFLSLTHGVTTVVISHRFSTVRQADRIVVLDQGRVAESGAHDELLATGGLYATMFRAQARAFAQEDSGA